jgi:hypothetical protein
MMRTVYPTIQAARDALSLDTGFDPFTSGGWGRPTRAKLARAGYVVDPAAYRAVAAQLAAQLAAHRCDVCGEPALDRQTCSEHGTADCGRCSPEPTGRCRLHTAWVCMCDNGHTWHRTGVDYRPCPHCGEHAT